MRKPTYKELEDFVREMYGHNSYWWQEAGDMADLAEKLVKRLDEGEDNA